MDPIEEFTAFHVSIRRAFRTLDEIAFRPAFDALDRKTAELLAVYFEGPLLWHDHDEEVSLLPRLLRRVSSTGDSDSLAACRLWHEHMEALLDRLAPTLREVGRGELPRLPLDTAESVPMLRGLLEAHLATEEQEVFPFARRVLSQQDLADIAGEIAMRRREHKDGARRALLVEP